MYYSQLSDLKTTKIRSAQVVMKHPLSEREELIIIFTRISQGLYLSKLSTGLQKGYFQS